MILLKAPCRSHLSGESEGESYHQSPRQAWQLDPSSVISMGPDVHGADEHNMALSSQQHALEPETPDRRNDGTLYMYFAQIDPQTRARNPKPPGSRFSLVFLSRLRSNKACKVGCLSSAVEGNLNLQR